MERTIQYNQNRDLIIDQLKTFGVLKEMTKEEIESYKNDPTLIKALTLNLDDKRTLDTKNVTISIKEGDEVSKISFTADKSFENIKIVEAKGPITNLSLEEQKNKIREELARIVVAGIDKFGDVDSFIKELNENSKIDLNNTNADKNIQSQELKDMKEKLEDYKANVDKKDSYVLRKKNK